MRICNNVVRWEQIHAIDCRAHTPPEDSPVLDITRLPITQLVWDILEERENPVWRLNMSKNNKDPASPIMEDITISYMRGQIDACWVVQLINLEYSITLQLTAR